MANNDIGIRFTDESYLTYSQVGRALGTYSIDNFWKQVEAYRKENRKNLPFGKIKGGDLYLTLSDAILAKIGVYEGKIDSFVRYAKHVANENPKEFRSRISVYLLKKAAHNEGSRMNEDSIRVLLSGRLEEDEESLPIERTLGCYDYYLDESSLAPDDSFLADCYSRLLGQEELTSFYRNSDFDRRVERLQYVLSPDYPYAPYQDLESLMSPFTPWLSSDDGTPSLVKAVVACFYMSYLLPFDKFNATLASFLAKDIFSFSRNDGYNVYIPFEILWGDFFKGLSEYQESKRTGDLTYLLFASMKLIDEEINNLTEELRKVRVEEIKRDFVKLSPAEVEISKKEEPVIEPAPVETTEEEPTYFEQPTFDNFEDFSYEEPKVEETPKPIETPKPAEKKIEVIKEYPDIEYVDDSLSKSEVKSYIRYIMERNPSLNKKQAAFLATHLSEGHFYTIKQYKESARCVYETARTSMDHLAELGFYEKKQYKNKFVYTPIKKGKK